MDLPVSFLARRILPVAVVPLLLATPYLARAQQGGQAAAGGAGAMRTFTVFDDALAAGWENWSWETRVELASPTAQAGNRGIAVQHIGAWGGFYLHHAGLQTGAEGNLRFWIHGGEQGGQNLWVVLQDKSGKNAAQVPIGKYVAGGAVPAGKWTQVSIPLQAFEPGSDTITGITLQNATDRAQSLYYVDGVEIAGNGTAAKVKPYVIPPFGPPAPQYPAPRLTGELPQGFPRHLWLGLASPPGGVEWMRQSEAAWAARYQYLAGGAGSAEGWTSWNQPEGEFATRYLQESRQSGHIPVLTYYQMLHTAPRRYDESLDAYREKMGNAGVMAAYYRDFRLLMQKCGAHGGLAVVHVEPDLWGYMQHSARTPEEYRVQVAGSGDGEAAGLPDNAVGFARMLVRLQRKYAPQTLLALHASPWAGGIDIGRNRDAATDVAGQARATGAWLKGLGEGWPLVFADLADRDAGYRHVVHGDGGVWWDETDAHLPSFNQYHHWLSHINQETGRRLVLWQVPIGNTRRRSCNNTQGHYQDNRVQYYLDPEKGRGRMEKLAQCGVIGLLFGRGDDNTTTYNDTRGDGITNPEPINGNAEMATVPDDDGGYLRERARAYCAAPVSLQP